MYQEMLEKLAEEKLAGGKLSLGQKAALGLLGAGVAVPTTYLALRHSKNKNREDLNGVRNAMLAGYRQGFVPAQANFSRRANITDMAIKRRLSKQAGMPSAKSIAIAAGLGLVPAAAVMANRGINKKLYNQSKLNAYTTGMLVGRDMGQDTAYHTHDEIGEAYKKRYLDRKFGRS